MSKIKETDAPFKAKIPVPPTKNPAKPAKVTVPDPKVVIPSAVPDAKVVIPAAVPDAKVVIPAAVPDAKTIVPSGSAPTEPGSTVTTDPNEKTNVTPPVV